MYDKPKISYLEAIIIAISSYGIIGNIFSLAGTVEKIILGIVVAILYLKLLDIAYLNVVLKIVAAIVWTLLLSAIFYTFVSLGVITAVFAVVMFILSMWLHKLDFIKWVKTTASLIERIFVKKEKIKLNGVKTKHPDPTYKELRKAMSLFLDTYWKYKSFIEKNNIQNRTLYKEATEANSGTIFVMQECASHKFMIDDATINWMRQRSRYYTSLTASMEREMQQQTQYTKQSSGYSNNRTGNTTNNASERKTNDMDESLFNGCNSAESLKTRYRQLMKMYHPDSHNGDTEMSQKIQKTYEELSARYGK